MSEAEATECDPCGDALSVNITHKARNKMWRLLSAHAMRRAVAEAFLGQRDVYVKTTADRDGHEYHVLVSPEEVPNAVEADVTDPGDGYAVVVVFDDEETAVVVTQCHRHTDYEADPRCVPVDCLGDEP